LLACAGGRGLAGGTHHGDEELRAVGVGAGVGCGRVSRGSRGGRSLQRRTHGQEAGRGVLELKVLVGKLHAIDGLAADARAVRKVAALGAGPRRVNRGWPAGGAAPAPGP
jgi:hypothetical protein